MAAMNKKNADNKIFINIKKLIINSYISVSVGLFKGIHNKYMMNIINWIISMNVKNSDKRWIIVLIWQYVKFVYLHINCESMIGNIFLQYLILLLMNIIYIV